MNMSIAIIMSMITTMNTAIITSMITTMITAVIIMNTDIIMLTMYLQAGEKRRPPHTPRKMSSMKLSSRYMLTSLSKRPTSTSNSASPQASRKRNS